MELISKYEKYFTFKDINIFELMNSEKRNILQHAAFYGNYEILYRYLLDPPKKLCKYTDLQSEYVLSVDYKLNNMFHLASCRGYETKEKEYFDYFNFMGELKRPMSSQDKFIYNTINLYPMGEYIFKNPFLDQNSVYPINRCFPTSRRFLCLKIILAWFKKKFQNIKEFKDQVHKMMAPNYFKYAPLHWAMSHIDILSSLLLFVNKPKDIFAVNYHQQIPFDLLLNHNSQRKISVGAVFIASPILKMIESNRITKDELKHYIDYEKIIEQYSIKNRNMGDILQLCGNEKNEVINPLVLFQTLVSFHQIQYGNIQNWNNYEVYKYYLTNLLQKKFQYSKVVLNQDQYKRNNLQNFNNKLVKTFEGRNKQHNSLWIPITTIGNLLRGQNLKENEAEKEDGGQTSSRLSDKIYKKQSTIKFIFKDIFNKRKKAKEEQNQIWSEIQFIEDPAYFQEEYQKLVKKATVMQNHLLKNTGNSVRP